MIDTKFSFVDDTPNYWDGFWDNGLGTGKHDPDSESKTLQKYHQELWSRTLPNGEKMDLSMGDGSSYLCWKDFRFGSDSIVVSFRYEKCRELLREVEAAVPDYHAFVEDFLRKTYTMGGMMIFPKHSHSINQTRGVNKQICDRFDLTLECIRRYYLGEDSPLYKVLESDNEFFQLFVDFRGFVDYFFLQDLVTEDYKTIRFFDSWKSFEDYPIPNTVEKYLNFLKKETEFVEKRNQRIEEFLSNQKTTA